MRMLTGIPIVGVTGANGSGKTLAAVSHCVDLMRTGTSVYSTVPIVDGENKSIALTSLAQLMNLRDCVVLFDEVSAIFSSRASANLPTEVEVFLQTARHRNVSIIWTAPAWTRADVILRQCTQAVLVCRPMIRKRIKGSPWPGTRVAQMGLLDTLTVAVDATPEKILRRGFVRLKGLSGWGKYDTHAEVPQIGRTASSGFCLDCGGIRKKPTCTPAYHASLGIPEWAAEDAAGGADAQATQEVIGEPDTSE